MSDKTLTSLQRMQGLVPPPGSLTAAMRPREPAKLAIERLGEQIFEFEALLSHEEEVGMVLVSGPGDKVFHIEKYYAPNMDLIVLEGINDHGKPQRLIQHVSQLNILLTALPKLSSVPRRIGFFPASQP